MHVRHVAGVHEDREALEGLVGEIHVQGRAPVLIRDREWTLRRGGTAVLFAAMMPLGHERDRLLREREAPVRALRQEAIEVGGAAALELQPGRIGKDAKVAAESA